MLDERPDGLTRSGVAVSMASCYSRSGTVTMHLAQALPVTPADFKVICDSCGSLTIKVADMAQAGSESIVHCGRCNAERGTVAELHSLARTGITEFTF